MGLSIRPHCRFRLSHFLTRSGRAFVVRAIRAANKDDGDDDRDNNEDDRDADRVVEARDEGGMGRLLDRRRELRRCLRRDAPGKSDITARALHQPVRELLRHLPRRERVRQVVCIAGGENRAE